MGLMASTGSVTFQGKPLPRQDPAAVSALGIVLVPEGRGIFGPMSVADNLELGAYTLGGDAAEYRRRLVAEIDPRQNQSHDAADRHHVGATRELQRQRRLLLDQKESTARPR